MRCRRHRRRPGLRGGGPRNRVLHPFAFRDFASRESYPLGNQTCFGRRARNAHCLRRDFELTLIGPLHVGRSGVDAGASAASHARRLRRGACAGCVWLIPGEWLAAMASARNRAEGARAGRASFAIAKWRDRVHASASGRRTRFRAAMPEAGATYAGAQRRQPRRPVSPGNHPHAPGARVTWRHLASPDVPDAPTSPHVHSRAPLRGSGSAWRSTSRHTGAVSPSPNARNLSRYAIGLPSVQPKYACGIAPVRSRRSSSRPGDRVRDRRARAAQHAEAADVRRRARRARRRTPTRRPARTSRNRTMSSGR